MSKKEKTIITIVLVITAVVVAAAAFAVATIRPPESMQAMTGDLDSDIVESEEAISLVGSERKEDFFTILVVGKDVASGNTDTIMLVGCDVKSKKMSVISIPRDTIVNVKRSVKKINGAYMHAGKDIFALYDEVESITGIRPDRYILVEVDGFVELIDAIGGVEVDVPIDMHYEDKTQDLSIHINKGLQVLDGYDSMGFMRYRKTYVEGDIGRIKTQHIFLKALAKKLLKAETLLKVPELAKIVKENVDTDLTLGNEIWIGKQMLQMDFEKDINIMMLPGRAGYYEKLSYYFPNEEEVIEMINEYMNPYIKDIKALNLFKKTEE